MALPLPQVVPDTGPGGSIVTAMRGINSLTNDNLEAQIRGAQAQYAPYANYWDTVTKQQEAQWLPFKYYSEAMSNPLLWLTNPQGAQALAANLGKFLPATPNVPMSSANIPMPSQGSGLLSLALNKMFSPDSRSAASSNALNQTNLPGVSSGSSLPPLSSGSPPTGMNFGAQNAVSPEQVAQIANQAALNRENEAAANPQAFTGNAQAAPSSLLPGSAGGASGYAAKITAPYMQSPYGSGALIPGQEGGGISIPTERSKTATQIQLLGEKRVEPQLERLASLWKPFLDLKGQSNLLGARVGNYINASMSPQTMSQLKQFGINPDSSLMKQYGEARATTNTAPEALVKAFGLNPTHYALSELKEVIEPYFGDTQESYSGRIMDTLHQLRDEQAKESQKALLYGYQLPGQPAQSLASNQSVQTSAPSQSGSISFAQGTNPSSQISEGQAAPKGYIYMFDKNNNPVLVHKSKIEEAKRRNLMMEEQ